MWDVADLTGYWSEHPPAHLALSGLQGALAGAAVMGGGAPELASRPAPRDPRDPKGIGALAAALGVNVEAGHGSKR